MDENIEQTLPEEVQREIGMAFGRATLPVCAVLMIATVQSIRFGIRASDYLLLIVGSIASIVSMMGYSLVTAFRASGFPKKAWMGLVSFCGFLAYFFSLYLLFYRGVWAFIAPAEGHSFWALFRSVIFCMLGYGILIKFYKITEIGRIVDTMLASKSGSSADAS